MTIRTRDFGEMELDEGAVLRFSAPIFGFESLERYVLLSDDEAGPGLLWLQSIEDPGVCFIILDPAEIGLDYTPQLPLEAARDLKLESPGDLLVRVIAVVPPDFMDTTVNLKSPIFINSKNQLAVQAILEAEYPIRMRLFDGGDAPC